MIKNFSTCNLFRVCIWEELKVLFRQIITVSSYNTLMWSIIIDQYGSWNRLWDCFLFWFFDILTMLYRKQSNFEGLRQSYCIIKLLNGSFNPMILLFIFFMDIINLDYGSIEGNPVLKVKVILLHYKTVSKGAFWVLSLLFIYFFFYSWNCCAIIDCWYFWFLTSSWLWICSRQLSFEG